VAPSAFFTSFLHPGRGFLFGVYLASANNSKISVRERLPCATAGSFGEGVHVLDLMYVGIVFLCFGSTWGLLLLVKRL
jgi:hypothetical protein